MGTTFTSFDADRIGSPVPVRLMHMEGLYELFVSKFALSSLIFSTSNIKVHCTMKLTYRTPPYDNNEDDMENLVAEDKEPRGDSDVPNHIKSQWDDDSPWAEWYSAEDPVKGFELTAIWSNNLFEGSLEMAELENASSFDAEMGLIYINVSQNMIDDSLGKLIGFATQLYLLVSALDKSFEAKFLEDFVSAGNTGSDNSKSSTSASPPVDRVLKELFHEDAALLGNTEASSAACANGQHWFQRFSRYFEQQQATLDAPLLGNTEASSAVCANEKHWFQWFSRYFEPSHIW